MRPKERSTLIIKQRERQSSCPEMNPKGSMCVCVSNWSRRLDNGRLQNQDRKRRFFDVSRGFSSFMNSSDYPSSQGGQIGFLSLPAHQKGSEKDSVDMGHILDISRHHLEAVSPHTTRKLQASLGNFFPPSSSSFFALGIHSISGFTRGR